MPKRKKTPRCIVIAGPNGAGKTTGLAAMKAARVREGGHDVPRSDVMRRFSRGWKNFRRICQTLADVWTYTTILGESRGYWRKANEDQANWQDGPHDCSEGRACSAPSCQGRAPDCPYARCSDLRLGKGEDRRPDGLARTVQRPSTSTNSHVFCGVQIRGNVFRKLKNSFIFSRIIVIFNSLPGQYPFWVVRYPKWVPRSGIRVVERQNVLALPTPCLRRYNSASWPSCLDTMSEVSMRMS